MSNLKTSKQQPPERPLRRVGRYEMYESIGVGGMATVHLGLLRGAGGFIKSVAIKRMHPMLAADADLAERFSAEARLASRVQSPYVVPTLDVLAEQNELFIVMELVVGRSLAQLAPEKQGPLSPALAVAIVDDLLCGLGAAHEAFDERGNPLQLVHRDVSPQNVMIGTDGRARLLDFGIAKVTGAAQVTEEGVVKGKVSYMPPEQFYGEALDRRTDLYAAGVVLWELLTGKVMFPGGGVQSKIAKVLEMPVASPQQLSSEVPSQLAAVVMKALSRDAADRHPSAQAMRDALEQCVKPASPEAVANWVKESGGESLVQFQERVSQVETLPEYVEAGPDVQLLQSEPVLAATGDVGQEDGGSLSSQSPTQRNNGGWVVAVVVVAAGMVFLNLGDNDSATQPAPAAPSDVVAASPPPQASGSSTAPPAPCSPAQASSAAIHATACSTAQPAASVAQPRGKASLSPAAGSDSSAATPKVAASAAQSVAPVAPEVAERDCNPPFTLTPEGHRVYKRHCF